MKLKLGIIYGILIWFFVYLITVIFKIGIIFILMDVICDFVFFVIRKKTNILIDDYPIHVISMIILTLITTTLLGYLAQMEIDLK